MMSNNPMTPELMAELREWLDVDTRRDVGRDDGIAMMDTIDAQAATIAHLEAELEKTTHPHFWWDVDDNENGCDDITSILDNYEVGEVVEVSCARNLPNQWVVGYVTESGGFRGQTFATEAEAVEFAAARAALTANHSAPVVGD